MGTQRQKVPFFVIKFTWLWLCISFLSTDYQLGTLPTSCWTVTYCLKESCALDLYCLGYIGMEGFVTGTLVSKGGLISGFERTCLWLIQISLKLMQLCKCSMRSCLFVKWFLAAYFEKK